MNAAAKSVKIIRLGNGLKRIINLMSGRDVIIAGARGRWVMHANFNQPDYKSELGKFASVADAASYVGQQYPV